MIGILFLLAKSKSYLHAKIGWSHQTVQRFHRNDVNVNLQWTTSWRQLLIRVNLFLCFLFLLCAKVHAHADGENYVWMEVQKDKITGRFELNIKDIASKLSIELDLEDNSEESLNKIAEVQSYIRQNFSLADDSKKLTFRFGDTREFVEKVEIIQFYFETDSDISSQLINVRNTIFLDQATLGSDRLHKSLLLLEYNKKVDKYFGAENVALIFDSRKMEQSLDLADPPSYHPWKDFFRQGILHIVYGFDHVLFVITLLLVSAISYSRETGWSPIDSVKTTIWNVFKVLTVFTIAHSITLTLSTFGLITVNIWLVELVIVLSIMVMALNNIRPVFPHNSLLIVFLFGLFHGVGFASVMNQLSFRNVFIERVVVLFNLGIEFGQLLIALVVMPVVYLLSKLPIYREWGMQLVSFVIALIALFWLFERSGFL